MKKFSLIVALMLALTVIFISCGADPLPPPPPDDSETFEDIDLGTEFNYFAGMPDNQAGWATDGQSEVDKKVGKLGLKAEDFQAAKFLVLELKVDVPDTITIIWGGEPAAAGTALGLSNAGWMDQPVVSGGKGAVGVTVEGRTVKIELAKALKRADAFKDPSLTELKLVVQCWSQKIVDLIDKAYLQISSLPPEFFPATGITIKPITGKIAKTNIKLEATITPKAGNTTTSVQLVTWEIVGGLKAPVDVDFALSSPVGINSVKLSDTIYVSKQKGGVVKVRATLKNGGLDADGNKIDIVSSVYEIVVGENPFPGEALANSDVADIESENINDFWKKDDATTYPKYLVIVSYLGSSGKDFSGYFDLSFNTGASAPNQEQRKGDPANITNVDGDGFVYFVIDLSQFTNYTRFMSDYGWGVQLRSWGVGFGDNLKVFLMKSSVTSLTKPVGAVDFVYDGTGAGTHGVLPGYYADKLPVELEWE